jgi:hypothetical protein
MHVLIDGHNLIGQIPDISLADPDDEAKLVLLLRRYALAKRGRQVIVVFDRGVYGHPQTLNGYNVTCYFARSPQDADTQLMRRIQAIQRPGDWLVVSSDREVAWAARERGIRVMSAHEFAAQLRSSGTPNARRPHTEEKPRDVRLSEAEIAEWMRLFGEEPDPPPEEDHHNEAATVKNTPQLSSSKKSRRHRNRKRRKR